MSSLRTKLARVHLPAWSRAGERSFTPEREFETAHHDSIADVEKHEAAPIWDELPLDPTSRLEALRRKIAGILTKAPPVAKRSPADPTTGDLPFLREETAHGPLYVRTRRLSAAHRVGRFGVQPASSVPSGMLALLALDPSIASADPRRALYLDTETTGLSGGTGTVPFLIGLAYFDEAGTNLFVEQLLLRELGQEVPMLERLIERARSASMLVTYNGKSFDVPLLRTRFVMNRMPAWEPMLHLDLVHVARRVHKRRLRQITLADVESQVLGFERTADISGGEVCSRYTHFLRTGDASALSAVVDHNEWDIVAMAALVGLYGEPLAGLSPLDWVGLSRVVKRAGSLELAGRIADEAVEKGVGSEAVRARAEIAKARGDKAQALADLASIVDSVDDPTLRLELAKLYEHHAKAPLTALELVLRGTGETEEASSRRRRRLERKAARTRR